LLPWLEPDPLVASLVVEPAEVPDVDPESEVELQLPVEPDWDTGFAKKRKRLLVPTDEIDDMSAFPL